MRGREALLAGALVAGVMASPRPYHDGYRLVPGSAGTRRPPAEPCTVASPAHPHEPAGFGQVARLDFSRPPDDDGWWTRPYWGSAVMASDPAAPISPPGIMAVSAPGASDSIVHSSALGAFGEMAPLTMQPVFHAELPLQPSSGAVYLDLRTRFTGTLNTAALVLLPVSGHPSTLILGQVRAGVYLERASLSSEWLPPDPGAPPSPNGIWHRWELVVRPHGASSSIEWWVDGTVHGSVADVDLEGEGVAGIGLQIRPDPALGGWAGIGIESVGGVAIDDLYLSGEICAGDHVRLSSNRVKGVYADSLFLATVLPEINDQLLDSNLETVTLLDARTAAGAGGCSDDHIMLTDLSHPNLLDASSCVPSSWDEIVVFSRDDAVQVDLGDADGPIWTDAAGEVRPVRLEPEPRVVKVVLWLTQSKDADDGLLEPRARRELQLASMLYNLNRTGVLFEESVIRVWKEPDPTAIRAAVGESCSTAGTEPYFNAGVVNVYYVPTVYGEGMTSGVDYLGYNCGGLGGPEERARFGNLIYISIARRIHNTLAHELGHALSLGHADDIVGPGYPIEYLMPSDNLMFGYNEAGSTVTLGQAFRVNLDPLSVLNVNGLRAGLPTRDCLATSRCPKVQLNWRP